MLREFRLCPERHQAPEVRSRFDVNLSDGDLQVEEPHCPGEGLVTVTDLERGPKVRPAICWRLGDQGLWAGCGRAKRGCRGSWA